MTHDPETFMSALAEHVHASRANAACRCPGSPHHAPHATSVPVITEETYDAPHGDLAAVLATLSTHVRIARDRRGWSMRDLAAHLGVVPSTIHRIEHSLTVIPKWLPPLLQWLAEQDTDQ